MTNIIPTLTVFTPAYNRAHTIERTYKSLCRQTNHDFMWIIIDDGSTDNTHKLCESWIFADTMNSSTGNEIIGYARDAKWLKIHYVYKKNGGMHTAHNEAYRHIGTELAVCIDSDDWMPDNGVEMIISRWCRYGNEKYAGMVGLDIFEDGYVVGTCFPKGLHECKTYDMGPKYGVVCDKKYVYRTDVIKKYLPYPEFEGERYGTVNYLYQVIDHDYDMLCSNDVYCIVEYQSDGLSVNIFNQLKQSPKTRAVECNIEMKHQPYLKNKLKKAIQYTTCAILSKNINYIKDTSSKVLVLLATPLGILYYIIIKYKKIKHLDINKVKHKLLPSDEC